MRDWRRISFYVFITALPLCLVTGYGLPRLLAPEGQASYNPPWVVDLVFSLGILAVIATPGAWRWIYRRRD